MDRHPISIRPTALQLLWLKAERGRRGIALNAIVLLAIEEAMTRTARPADPEQAGHEGI